MTDGYNRTHLFHQACQSTGNKFKKLKHASQCQFGCGLLKMVGPKMLDFCPRIDTLKGIVLKQSFDEL